jgi:hypothetical protein
MDSSEIGVLEPDVDAESLRRRFSQPSTPNELRRLVSLGLVQVFWEGIKEGRLLTPAQMVRALRKLARKHGRPRRRRTSNQSDAIDYRRLALQLVIFEHGYCTAARIYADYVRERFPAVKTATRGRPRSIDSTRDILMRDDLSQIEKAERLGIKTKTAEEKRRARDVVRKRIALILKRSAPIPAK